MGEYGDQLLLVAKCSEPWISVSIGLSSIDGSCYSHSKSILSWPKVKVEVMSNLNRVRYLQHYMQYCSIHFLKNLLFAVIHVAMSKVQHKPGLYACLLQKNSRDASRPYNTLPLIAPPHLLMEQQCSWFPTGFWHYLMIECATSVKWLLNPCRPHEVVADTTANFQCKAIHQVIIC